MLNRYLTLWRRDREHAALVLAPLTMVGVTIVALLLYTLAGTALIAVGMVTVYGVLYATGLPMLARRVRQRSLIGGGDFNRHPVGGYDNTFSLATKPPPDPYKRSGFVTQTGDPLELLRVREEIRATHIRLAQVDDLIRTAPLYEAASALDEWTDLRAHLSTLRATRHTMAAEGTVWREHVRHMTRQSFENKRILDFTPREEAAVQSFSAWLSREWPGRDCTVYYAVRAPRTEDVWPVGTAWVHRHHGTLRYYARTYAGWEQAHHSSPSMHALHQQLNTERETVKIIAGSFEAHEDTGALTVSTVAWQEYSEAARRCREIADMIKSMESAGLIDNEVNGDDVSRWVWSLL